MSRIAGARPQIEAMENKSHWETVYQTKNPDQVSWTQEIPKISLEFFELSALPKTAKIIDIGGGDSKLVDCLLDLGYENITVLDISATAIGKAKLRLGERAARVNWIISDITDFDPQIRYDVWHDRAAFHFLTDRDDISKYASTARKCVAGFLIIGTFSTSGPTKCSGLEISQYSDETLQNVYKNGFEKINCAYDDHTTPFGTKQNFVFCSFRRKNTS